MSKQVYQLFTRILYKKYWKFTVRVKIDQKVLRLILLQGNVAFSRDIKQVK